MLMACVISTVVSVAFLGIAYGMGRLVANFLAVARTTGAYCDWSRNVKDGALYYRRWYYNLQSWCLILSGVTAAISIATGLWDYAPIAGGLLGIFTVVISVGLVAICRYPIAPAFARP